MELSLNRDDLPDGDTMPDSLPHPNAPVTEDRNEGSQEAETDETLLTAEDSSGVAVYIDVVDPAPAACDPPSGLTETSISAPILEDEGVEGGGNGGQSGDATTLSSTSGPLVAPLSSDIEAPTVPLAQTADNKGRRTRWYARRSVQSKVAAGVAAFLLFLFTPVGDYLRKPLTQWLRPALVEVGNAVAPPGVNIDVSSPYEGIEHVVATEIREGDKAPDGCFDSGWLEANDGVPLFHELYVSVSTGRSDVILVGSDIVVTRSPFVGKSGVTCNQGGDGAVTIFAYMAGANNTIRAIRGPGASDDGKEVTLPLAPGESYPIAITMVATSAQRISYSGWLVFMVNGKRTRVGIGSGKVTGIPANLPWFTAEDGRWVHV
jgi:hypothetical protein